MKSILCFGDSNTWGYDPAGGGRFDRTRRWPGALQTALGADYHVIEEGLPGRTTVWDDPLEEHRNGRAYLPACLASHAPLDGVILLLGTNDLKNRFALSAPDIARGVAVLARVVRDSGAGPAGTSPRLLIVAPPPLVHSRLSADLFGGGVRKSRKLARHYQTIATEFGAEFFPAARVVRSSRRDGVHWEEPSHQALGRELARVIARAG